MTTRVSLPPTPQSEPARSYAGYSTPRKEAARAAVLKLLREAKRDPLNSEGWMSVGRIKYHVCNDWLHLRTLRLVLYDLQADGYVKSKRWGHNRLAYALSPERLASARNVMPTAELGSRERDIADQRAERLASLKEIGMTPAQIEESMKEWQPL